MMTQLESLELNSGIEIDGICDAFESKWRSGERPQIEDYLGSTVTSERSTLLFELVCVEAHYRRQAGEAPELDEYLRRFPDDFSDESGPSLAEALALPPSSEIDQPRSIGNFDLIEKLGEGAFGSVWKARDRTLDRTVAVKLPRGAGLEAAEAEAFRREARAAAQLGHPNIVAVHGIERSEKTAFIVSAFVDGMNLKEWLKQNRPTFEESVALCAKLADALVHAHAKGIIHRDLKPANILLDRAGEPHITDFGLAKRLSGDASICAGQQVVGTPAYMSPEQALGNSTNADARTDVYSLGIIFYELLTGRRAFEGDQQAVLRQVQSADPKAPREVRPEIPSSLEAICLKAIAKSPGDRYQTVDALAADLKRYQRSEPVQAPAPKRAEGGRRWSRRKLIGAGLASVPLIGAAGWWFGSGFGTSRGHRPIVMQTEPAGAEVWFIPLDPQTGEPDPTGIVPAGKSPVSLELPPGDYLVEAVLEENRFHEVYRRVPDFNVAMAEGGAHRFSKVESDQRIRLPIIIIPESSVTKGMARIQDVTYRSNQVDQRAAASLLCPTVPFLVDPFEFTCRDYRALMSVKLPPHIERIGLSDQHAMPVSFDIAVAVAERLGKRLLDVREFEFAATGPGNTIVPIAENGTSRRERETETVFGPVDDFPIDRIDRDPGVPIYGLRSNVAEWTMTWGLGQPLVIDGAKPPDDRPDNNRIVCGGDERVIRGAITSGDRIREGLIRNNLWRAQWKPGLGVRFARSVHPRTTRECFHPLNRLTS